jgi:hypothetical protein
MQAGETGEYSLAQQQGCAPAGDHQAATPAVVDEMLALT